jgi:mannose-6-phosphate isomerase
MIMTTSQQSSLSEWIPFRVTSQFVERVWGWNDLRPWYDEVAKGNPIGEAWLTGDECLVATGPHAGHKLGELFIQAPQALLGTGAHDPGSPLLLKVIFAREKLSVQVHPDDAMAQKYGEPRGKTECWYALAADPGAKVACGIKPGVSLKTIEEGIHSGTLEENLNVLDVAAGDMVYVDAGTVHAIWPGSILLETQQNCDLTYRLYDYGRPRQLHVEKSLEAMRLTSRAGKIPAKDLKDRSVLLDVEYFRVERLHKAGSWTSASLRDEGEAAPGLAYLFAAAGTGRLTGEGFEPVELPARGIIAIPAAAPDFTVEDLGGLDLFRITPRWPSESR